MKWVYFVRHAKSSWDDLTLPDHDRPLNGRGKRDCVKMGEHVAHLPQKIQLLISSTATRALRTAKAFQESHGLAKDRLVATRSLYHSSPDEMINELYMLQDDVNVVAIFAHNPGMTMAINEVSDGYIDNVPTCGVFLVACETERWLNFDLSNAQLVQFLKPKEL